MGEEVGREGHFEGLSLISQSSSTLPVAGEVVVCARCAAVLGKGEEVVIPGGLEFESASQVFSHVSYPQWGSEGEKREVTLQDMTLLSLDLGSSSIEQPCSAQAGERDQETASDITLESHDTWGGLAPSAPPQPPTSDEVMLNLGCHGVN